MAHGGYGYAEKPDAAERRLGDNVIPFQRLPDQLQPLIRHHAPGGDEAIDDAKRQHAADPRHDRGDVGGFQPEINVHRQSPHGSICNIAGYGRNRVAVKPAGRKAWAASASPSGASDHRSGNRKNPADSGLLEAPPGIRGKRLV